MDDAKPVSGHSHPRHRRLNPASVRPLPVRLRDAPSAGSRCVPLEAAARTVSGVACEDCGNSDANTWLSNVLVCDRCYDKRIAEYTGFPRLPDPPPPVLLHG